MSSKDKFQPSANFVVDPFGELMTEATFRGRITVSRDHLGVAVRPGR